MKTHDHQTSYSALREVLKRLLAAEVESSRGTRGCGGVVLRARNSLGPVLALPDHPARWVFLTAPDDPGAAGSSTSMVGARLRMAAPDVLPLPPSVTGYGPARWIVAPGPGTCTPPSLQAVLSAAWQTVGA